MSTYTQILYQIVFSTYKREPSIVPEKKEQLFRYIWGCMEKRNCKLYRINGVEDHLHIITHLHPSQSLADLVHDIKLASGNYIKRNALFPYFNGWQKGYGAFTYTNKEKQALVQYVMNQEAHHRTVDLKDEYIGLLIAHEIEYNEDFLFD